LIKKGEAGPFCSKQCSGKYGAYVQNGGKRLFSVEIEKKYAKFKDIKKDEW